MNRDNVFEAGIGRVCITPPLSAPHAGWGAQTHVFADGVESDLHATVLVLKSDSNTFALVEMDLVIISRDESDAIRAAVSEILDIPISNVRASVTHNHAGPPPSSWNWMAQGREALSGYYALLPSLVSGAALQGARNCRPARFGVSMSSSAVSVNRREQVGDGMATGVNWDGPVDQDLLVARIDGIDQSPIAAIVGYTMHPTTLGPGNRFVSPDWPGHLKRTVEALTDTTCFFVQGATGDIGPGPDGFSSDPADAIRIGRRVGCDAVAAYLETFVPERTYRHERIWHSGAPLGKWTYTEESSSSPVVAFDSMTADLPVRPQTPLAEAEAAVESAQANLQAAIAGSAPESEIEDATFAVKRANMTFSRSRTFGGRETFPLEISAVRIGPLMLIGTEGEPFSEIGERVKSRSPFKYTWFGGYTGGWFGYVPTPDAYPLGGYEVDTSPYTPDAAQVLEDATIELIERMTD
jgi:hypothetical protein